MSENKQVYYDEILDTPIPEKDLVTLNSGTSDMFHYFNIYTLVKAYTSTGKLENPYTREPLPKDVVERIKSYMRVDLILKQTNMKISFNGAVHLYEVLLELIVKLRGDVKLCVSSDVYINGVSLYSYDLTSEISSLNIPNNSTVTLVTHVCPTKLSKLASALQNGSDTHKLVFADLIKKHLENGDIVWRI